MKFERTHVLTLAAIVCSSAFTAAASADNKAEARVFPTDVINIASAANGGRVLAATSQLNGDAAYAPGNLIDGELYNPVTKKGSAGWISGRFDPVNMDAITFGFKDNELHRVGKLVLAAGSQATPERWAKDIEVQVSTESAEGPYTAVAQLTMKRVPEPQSFVILPTQARFVRLMFRSNWGSDRAVALGEVEIYDSIDTTEPMGGVIARLESAIQDLQQYNTSQRELGNVARVSTPAPVSSNLRPASLRLADTAKPAAAAPSGGGNIAAARNGGRIVDVTSTFLDDPTYSANNLLDGANFSIADGKGSAGWASQSFAPGRQWVTVGFREDRTRLISKIVINPVSNQSSLRWASRIDVQVTTGSPTDGPWRTIETLNVRSEPVNQDFEVRPAEAKYVRFVFTANGPGNPSPLGDPNVSSDRAVSLGEIEIYEPVAANNDLQPLIGRFNQVLTDLKRLRGQGLTAAATPVETPAAPAPAALTIFPASPGAVTTLSEARVARSTYPPRPLTTAKPVKKAQPIKK